MKEYQNRPEIVVFAGPNGSGKSTFICHIYDNSFSPYRIFKRRKEEFFMDESEDWLKEDIELLTRVSGAKKINLNKM